jgi:phosphate transport system ATP-binding protein
VILGDEPTSALDPRSSRTIEEKFLTLKSQYTIILVTHILRQARRLADYVIFLYDGRIMEHGPAEQVFGEPREKLTREYIQGVFS